MVCKEAEGRFFKIHELEFCQQEHFVAKVPAPESGYSVKADSQKHRPKKPFCDNGKGGGQCYFLCNAFLYRLPVETQVKGFQQESPDGGNHVELPPQTAVGKIEKVKYIPGKHQGGGNGAQHGGAQKQVADSLETPAQGVFSLKKIFVPPPVQTVVDKKEDKNRRPQHFVVQVLKKVVSHKEQEQDIHSCVHGDSDYFYSMCSCFISVQSKLLLKNGFVFCV